jgi:outer membrane protein assembly factor BamB
MSSPIVHEGSVFVFVNYVGAAGAYSGGNVSWASAACTQGWVGAPAIDATGHILGACRGSSLFKLDRSTGQVVQSAGYQPGVTELMIDGLGQVKAGHQAFNGVFFQGSFDTWDADLNYIGSLGSGNYATSRASVLPDRTSTIRIGYSFDIRFLNFAGQPTNWETVLPAAETPATVPSVDRDGTIYFGNDRLLVAVNPSDGSTRWNLQLDTPITTQPVIPQPGVIYVGTSGGQVYRLHD